MARFMHHFGDSEDANVVRAPARVVSKVEAVEAALRESEVDIAAFQHVKRIKLLNESLASTKPEKESEHDRIL
ncbi:hypothetical protein JHK82_044594 [Glycine max]|nr:hypothetical protein JHK82_044594 [Glycine max]